MRDAMSAPRRVLKAIRWALFGNSSQRRRVRQECARLAAGLFGDFPISEDHKLWRTDIEFLERYAKLSPDNPYSQDRKYTLRELVRYVRRIPGAMAECGCYEGASAYFMASSRPESVLHLFDSFQGLPSGGSVDAPGASDTPAWRAGDLTASESVLNRNLDGFKNFVVHKGWIPEKFVDVKEERFCLVHIDVDLYEPTLASLRFFYPRVSAGGVIVLDDYGFATCPGAHRAVAEFMAEKPEYVLHLPTGQGVIIRSDQQP